MNTAEAFLAQNRTRLGLDEAAVGPSCLILTPRFEASRHVVFLVIPYGQSRPNLVVKIPRLPETTSSLAGEAESLRAVQRLRPDGFATVPRVVAFEEHGGRFVLVETALSGPLMSPAVVRRRPEDCCRRILDWLVELQRPSLRASGPACFTMMVEHPLGDFVDVFPLSDADAVLVARTRELLAPLGDATLPFVCEHGDLSHPNLILHGPNVAVIDWELARLDGLVAYDLFFFLGYVAFSLRNARSPHAQLQAFDNAFFGDVAWTRSLVHGYATELGLPIDALAPLFVLTWARYTIYLLQRMTGGGTAKKGRVPETAAAALRAHRYYRMWHHAISHAHRLGIS